MLLRLFAKTIDVNKINISRQSKSNTRPYDPSIGRSEGEHIAAHHSFGTIYVIDDQFSRLLNTNNDFRSKNMTFMNAVEKADRFDPYRLYKEYRTRPLYKNWNNFLNMFGDRHNLIHGMTRIELSNAKIATLCDNTITFLDIAIALCKMDKDVFDLL